jgi:hypothetical protein
MQVAYIHFREPYVSDRKMGIVQTDHVAEHSRP